MFNTEFHVYGETHAHVPDELHWKFDVGQQSFVVEHVPPSIPTLEFNSLKKEKFGCD